MALASSSSTSRPDPPRGVSTARQRGHGRGAVLQAVTTAVPRMWQKTPSPMWTAGTE
jgi:hypothetical protein